MELREERVGASAKSLYIDIIESDATSLLLVLELEDEHGKGLEVKGLRGRKRFESE